ncbi:MAG: hypothetical protein ACXWBP_08650 [Limisphaerales bacterium]
MTRKKQTVIALTCLVGAAVGIAILFPSAKVTDSVSLRFLGYTNDASSQPFALLELGNNTSVDICPYVYMIDTGTNLSPDSTPLDPKILGRGKSRIIRLSARKSAETNTFNVYFAQSDLRLKLYNLGSQFHMQSLLPNFSSLMKAVSTTDRPATNDSR